MKSTLSELSEPGDVMVSRDVAQMLRVSERQVTNLANDGTLPGAFKVGSRWRFYRPAVVGWIRGRSTQPVGRQDRRLPQSESQSIEDKMDLLFPRRRRKAS